MSQQTVAETELKKVAAFLPAGLAKALKLHAVETDSSVTEIIERLVRAELGIKAESHADPQPTRTTQE